MLRKKMFRDIKANKSQFIAIFLMVFLGVFAYCGIRSYMSGMKQSADKFYKECNMQDLNVRGENFSYEDLEKIKSIDNVKNAERKLTIVASVEEEEDKTLQLNFIESNEISIFHVFKGEKFAKNKSGLWIDNYYAENNNIKVGDTIKLKYDGIELSEEVLGLINVPDHVYDMKDESAIFPDHKDYGFAYLSANELSSKHLPQVFNQVIVDVNIEKNKTQVKSDIEDQVKSAIAVTDIKDSISYQGYQGEIEEGETYVGVFSGLFLFIAVLSVITTMTRVVKKQRTQIGTLKALGFKNRQITMHYVGYGFWISLIAALIGFILGPLIIGNFFMGMEMKYFEVPNGKAGLEWSCVVVTIVVVIAISIITYLACKSELKECPAETLREKIPVVRGSKRTVGGIFQNMSFSSKWNLRDMLRNKIRTIMGIAGIVGCTAILVCAFGMLDTMNNYLDWQFDELYNFKYKLTLKSDYTGEQYQKIIDKYGNSTTQTLLIEIDSGNKKESNNILVDDSNNLVRYTDKNAKFVKLKDDGVFITRKLADSQGLGIGDKIKWHIYGDDNYYETKIVGIDKDPQNQNIKMTKDYMENGLGLTYHPDSIYTNSDLSGVTEIEGVEIIQDKEALKSGMAAMLNTMRSVIVLLIVIAAILGVVIIYNLGILSFTEKQYQFATLKVLGFKDKQIRNIYIKQNNWITIMAIIIGLPVGFYLTDFIFKMAIADKYDFGAHIEFISYVYAVVGTAIVSWLSSHILAKKVNKIDMVTSLKGNE